MTYLPGGYPLDDSAYALYLYDGVYYNLTARYEDVDGEPWRFNGEWDGATPLLARVDDDTDRRQVRTLSDVDENFGPLTVVANTDGPAVKEGDTE